MKIFAVGMNYAAHNQALHGTTARPAEPVIFTKADSALLQNGKPFFVPDHLGPIEYEGEVVVRISRLGKGIAPQFARRYYDAATVGIDFTARALQRRLRSEGKPWELSKGFDGSAVVGEWRPLDSLPDIQSLPFRLDLDGRTVQQGNTADMLYAVDELVSFISQYFTIKTGDLLYTGTPVGTAAVSEGNHLQGFLCDEKVLDFYCR